MEIVFATGNKNKIVEANELLGTLKNLQIVSLRDKNILEEIPETGSSIAANAKQKAWYVYRNYGYNCFSEDSGLEVDSLDGAPAVHSARYAGPQKSDRDNIQLLLKSMKNEVNRIARFRTVICLILNGDEYLFEGTAEGQILPVERGTSGFGYDPVFQPVGYSVSFAEMTKSEKTKISHRGKAVRQLVNFLTESFDKKNGYQHR
jgi:XTP/dITP diphosphohydrolase